MTNFFYTDESGQRLGPYNDVQLKALAVQGFITPYTVLETDTGHQGQAGQIPGVFDSHQQQPLPNQYRAASEANGRAKTGERLGWVSIGAWLIPLIGLPVSITGLVFSIKGGSGLGKTLNIIGLTLSIINAVVGAILALLTVSS